jgi:hypothetical protein
VEAEVMQLQLNTDELNLLADTLLERVGTTSARKRLSADVQGNADREQDEPSYDDLLDKVLMRDLRLDVDELEQVADLLGNRQLYLRHEIARLPNFVLLLNLNQKLKLVEHILERVNEA